MTHSGPEAEGIVCQRFARGDSNIIGRIAEQQAEQVLLIRQPFHSLRAHSLVRIPLRSLPEQRLIRKAADGSPVDLLFRIRHHNVEIALFIHDLFFRGDPDTGQGKKPGKPFGNRRIQGFFTHPFISPEADSSRSRRG